MEREALIDSISKLRKDRNAIILAHYYQEAEIHDIADFIGDSLELSRKASKIFPGLLSSFSTNFIRESIYSSTIF